MSDFDSDPPPPRWQSLLLALVGLAVAGAIIFAAFRSKGAEPAPCIDAEMREQVRGLMLAGIDEALRRHTRRVFDVWMKDPADQPKRAVAGLNTAVSAYVRSRASAQRWNPPACER
jgi:2-phospho-L-lactate guanylyltransferase (CobY/MobA/RfbA family)